ncbi:MAG TPA: hypothetical protein VH062_13490 [Polyangiaceae bacterium]|jgi:hypothetical protein|nr:hypothetical protein [Polyangiaceae bacterium]
MSASRFERSHGKVRVIAQRPSDQQPVDTGARRNRDHHADGTFKTGNRAAENARGKQAVVKSLRAARRRLKETLSSELPTSERDELLDGALRRFDAARRDLGAESVLVLSPLARWAATEELVDYMTIAAAHVGFTTPAGERLLARRDALEGKANRAMSAALAAATALGTAPAKTRGAPAGFEEAP